MILKAKVFKLGNSRAVYIPKEFEIGNEYEFVYTLEGIKEEKVYTEPKKEASVYTPNHIKKSGLYDFCPKHPLVMRINCPCKK